MKHLKEDFPYFQTFIGFGLLTFAFETYLDYRQHQRYKIKRLPKELSSIVTTEEFSKSQDYGLDKSSFRIINSLFNEAFELVVYTCSVLPWVWDFSGSLIGYFGLTKEYEITQSIVYVMLCMITSQLLDIPWSAYQTFVIEEKYKFNKTTPKTFILDILKSFLVGFVIGVPFLSAFLHIIKWGGEDFYIYIWAFMFLFQIFIITIYPVLIQPLFNKVDPLEDGSLKTKIEDLAKRTNFPLTKIFKIDGSTRSSHSNAYFYGFWKNKRIVLYDTLMNQASEEEIIAILGHELGHYFMNHVLYTLIISQIHSFIMFFLFGSVLNNQYLLKSFGFELDDCPTIISFVLFMAIYSPISHVLNFGMTLMSRRNEFQADAYATKLGFGSQLSQGLITIYKENKSNLWPDEWYSTYHFSHPPLIERLAGIQREVKKSI